MQTKSAAWFSALTAGSVEWRYGIDILAADEQTPLENPLVYDASAPDRLVPKSAQIQLDVQARTHRQFSLNLRSSDGRYLVGPAGFPSGGAGSPTANGLVWYSARYRPWIDLMTGFDANGDKVYDRTYLGVFVLTNPVTQVRSVGTQTQINLLDKSTLLCKPYLITSATLPTFNKGGHTVGGYAKGATFDGVMSSLATKGGIPANKQNFSPSTLTLPADYSIQEGTEWWQHLQALAGSMAHVIYFDGTGNLVRRPDPLLAVTPSAYTFADGPLSIISEVDRKTDLTATYNHIIAQGASNTSALVRGEAQVNDPGNPYHKNQIGERVCYVGKDGKLNDMTPDPAIGTAAQAQTRAQQVLARSIGQQESVTIKGRNIPALEPYDRVTVAVNDAGLNLDFSIDKITWPLHHDSGGAMQLECSRWFVIGS